MGNGLHILVAAIGRFRPGPEQLLFAHYSKRLPWKITLKEHEIKKPLPAQQRKEEEAALLLAACKDADHIIAMDEKGNDLGSTAFAAHLRKRRDAGDRVIAFVIGGADGLHENVKKQAHLLLSFGRATWPHLLMRGLLAEQLYRACSISGGHPYHRE